MSAQDEFDHKYVTSAEICVDLGVSRVSLFNRRKAGHLPDAIEVRSANRIHLFIWNREQIAPFIAQWQAQLQRGS